MSMGATNYQIEDVTMGLELELPGFSAVAYREVFSYIEHRWADDGSVREQTYVIDGLPIAFRQRDSRGQVVLPSGVGSWEAGFTGAELVTEPYPYRELRPLAQRLAIDLQTLKAVPEASIHIHVDVADQPWAYVQNLLKIVAFLEAPLMRIAAGGRGSHRGTSQNRPRVSGRVAARRTYNDYRYARPLSDPIGVENQHGDRIPLIDLDLLLGARSASEFYAAWGRLDLLCSSASSGLRHYVPHRLHMVNLYSVPRQGTFEWRLFDAVYQHLRVFLDVVAAIHVLAALEPAIDLRSILRQPYPMTLARMYMEQKGMAGSSPEQVTQESYEIRGRLEALFQDALGKPVSLHSVWGPTWMAPTKEAARASHYESWSMATVSHQSVRRIVNSYGNTDDGSAGFILYHR
jgi:hypothetical protein